MPSLRAAKRKSKKGNLRKVASLNESLDDESVKRILSGGFRKKEKSDVADENNDDDVPLRTRSKSRRKTALVLSTTLEAATDIQDVADEEEDEQSLAAASVATKKKKKNRNSLTIPTEHQDDMPEPTKSSRRKSALSLSAALGATAAPTEAGHDEDRSVAAASVATTATKKKRNMRRSKTTLGTIGISTRKIEADDDVSFAAASVATAFKKKKNSIDEDVDDHSVAAASVAGKKKIRRSKSAGAGTAAARRCKVRPTNSNDTQPLKEPTTRGRRTSDATTTTRNRNEEDEKEQQQKQRRGRSKGARESRRGKLTKSYTDDDNHKTTTRSKSINATKDRPKRASSLGSMAYRLARKANKNLTESTTTTTKEKNNNTRSRSKSVLRSLTGREPSKRIISESEAKCLNIFGAAEMITTDHILEQLDSLIDNPAVVTLELEDFTMRRDKKTLIKQIDAALDDRPWEGIKFQDELRVSTLSEYKHFGKHRSSWQRQLGHVILRKVIPVSYQTRLYIITDDNDAGGDDDNDELCSLLQEIQKDTSVTTLNLTTQDSTKELVNELIQLFQCDNRKWKSVTLELSGQGPYEKGTKEHSKWCHGMQKATKRLQKVAQERGIDLGGGGDGGR